VYLLKMSAKIDHIDTKSCCKQYNSNNNNVENIFTHRQVHNNQHVFNTYIYIHLATKLPSDLPALTFTQT